MVWICVPWLDDHHEKQSNFLSKEGVQQPMPAPPYCFSAVEESLLPWPSVCSCVGCDHSLGFSTLTEAAELGLMTRQFSCRRMWGSSPCSAPALLALHPSAQETISAQPSLHHNSASVLNSVLECALWRSLFQLKHPFVVSEKQETRGPHKYRVYTSWFHT